MSRAGGAVELLERSLAYTCTALAARRRRRPPAWHGRRRARGWDLGQLLAHMDDALDAFTEAAAGLVEVHQAAGPPARAGSRRCGTRRARCSAPGATRRPPRVGVGGPPSSRAAAGRDRRARDHRARLGRRARDRPRAPGARRPGRWPARRSRRALVAARDRSAASPRRSRRPEGRRRTCCCWPTWVAPAGTRGWSPWVISRLRGSRRALGLLGCGTWSPRTRVSRNRGRCRAPTPRSTRPCSTPASSCAGAPCARHWPRSRPSAAPRHDRRRSTRRSWLAALVECRLARGDLAEAMALGDELSPLLDAGGAPPRSPTTPGASWPARSATPSSPLAHFLTAGRIAPDVDAELAPWRAGAALAALRSGDPPRRARPGPPDARRGHDRRAPPGRRSRCAPWPPSTPRERAATARPPAPGPRPAPDGTADRLAAQIDTDLAGLLPAQPRHGADGRARRWRCCARPRSSPAARSCGRCRAASAGCSSGSASAAAHRPRGRAVLTASERRVARLAVDGLSNRAIAERARRSASRPSSGTSATSTASSRSPRAPASPEPWGRPSDPAPGRRPS